MFSNIHKKRVFKKTLEFFQLKKAKNYNLNFFQKS